VVVTVILEKAFFKKGREKMEITLEEINDACEKLCPGGNPEECVIKHWRYFGKQHLMKFFQEVKGILKVKNLDFIEIVNETDAVLIWRRKDFILPQDLNRFSGRGGL
jgi:hypothetical protein